jgi:hypothetical protein
MFVEWLVAAHSCRCYSCGNLSSFRIGNADYCVALEYARVAFRWVGYIKDYDGGTLMECYIHPGMDYLNVSTVVAKQRLFIAERTAARSM